MTQRAEILNMHWSVPLGFGAWNGSTCLPDLLLESRRRSQHPSRALFWIGSGVAQRISRKENPMNTQMLMTLSVLTFAGFVSSASAGGGSTPVSFDEIRSACLNPSLFHNQIAPSNIQVSCTDVQTKWIADPAGSIAMANTRDVTSSVISDDQF